MILYWFFWYLGHCVPLIIISTAIPVIVTITFIAHSIFICIPTFQSSLGYLYFWKNSKHFVHYVLSSGNRGVGSSSSKDIFQTPCELSALRSMGLRVHSNYSSSIQVTPWWAHILHSVPFFLLSVLLYGSNAYTGRSKSLVTGSESFP